MGNEHRKGAGEDVSTFGSNAECVGETFGSRASKDVKLWRENRKAKISSG